jgi:tetratricopeptide (TPR) repeat protein
MLLLIPSRHTTLSTLIFCLIRSQKANSYPLKAGEKAVSSHAVEEAVHHYLRCLKRLELSFGVEEALIRQLVILEKSGNLFFWRGAEEFMSILERMAVKAKEFNNEDGIKRTSYWLIQLYYQNGFFNDAEYQINLLLTRLEIKEDRESITHLTALKGRICMHKAQFRDAIKHITAVKTKENRCLSPIEYYHHSGVLVVNLSVVGAFSDAGAIIDELTEMESTLPASTAALTHQSMVHGYLGSGYFWRGEWEKAIDESSLCIELGRKIGILLPVAWALHFKGASCCYIGKQDLGYALLEEGLGIAHDLKIGVGLSNAYALPAEAYALGGRFDEAKEMAEKTLKLAEQGNSFGELYALRAIAIIEAQTNGINARHVREQFGSCLEIAASRNMRPDLAITHFRYAELQEKRGDLDLAREQLDKATDLFREMEMTWWLARGEALRKTLDVG